MSTFGSVVDLLSKVIEYMQSKFDHKVSEKEKIESEFKRLKKELSISLAEGRICDSWSINERLVKLRMKMDGTYRRRKFVNVILIGVMPLFLFFGCRTDYENIPLITGKRVLVVSPGETIVVPELVEPAHRWYLVDDVGLMHWLGIASDTYDGE